MSTLGLDTRTLWYLSRGTGMVALMLLTIAFVLGVASMTPGPLDDACRGYVVAGLHRNVSLLLVVFVWVHIATAVARQLRGHPADRRGGAVRSSYRPVWIGLGAIASICWLAVDRSRASSGSGSVIEHGVPCTGRYT